MAASKDRQLLLRRVNITPCACDCRRRVPRRIPARWIGRLGRRPFLSLTRECRGSSCLGFVRLLSPYIAANMPNSSFRICIRSCRDTPFVQRAIHWSRWALSALEELFERHSLTHQLTDAASVTGAVSATLNVEYIGVREWSWRINGSGLTPGLSAIAMRISARSDSSRRSVAA